MAIGFSMAGCSNDSTETPPPSPTVIKALSPDGVAIILSTDNGSRAARAFNIDDYYYLTIVRPGPQDTAGSVQTYTKEYINGAYVGFVEDNHGNMIIQNILINGDTIVSAGEIIGTPGDYMGSSNSG
jgi:hypothetical protein